MSLDDTSFLIGIAFGLFLGLLGTMAMNYLIDRAVNLRRREEE